MFEFEHGAWYQFIATTGNAYYGRYDRAMNSNGMSNRHRFTGVIAVGFGVHGHPEPHTAKSLTYGRHWTQRVVEVAESSPVTATEMINLLEIIAAKPTDGSDTPVKLPA